MAASDIDKTDACKTLLQSSYSFHEMRLSYNTLKRNHSFNSEIALTDYIFTKKVTMPLK